MEYMPEISIIIPIYNTEKYLSMCIDSIVIDNENYNDCEIILVNDGSTDESENVCKLYANKYKNIVYLKKKNGGLSDARNFGIKNSHGKYILFIDSDDFIEKNSLKRIMEYVNKKDYDVVFLKAFKYKENILEELDQDINMDNLASKNEVLNYIASMKKFPR